jgi:hypothetical protein
VVEAVQCAVEVQRELAAEGGSGLKFRMGVHLGDVLVDGDDLLGEGVNLAARLQSMAEPGGILISQQVYDQVQKKLSVGFHYLGERQPKNFAESVVVYSVGESDADATDRKGKGRKAPAARGSKRARFIASAQRWGVILAVLLVLDLMTGDGFWVQWPALGVAMWLALRSGPLFERSN